MSPTADMQETQCYAAFMAAVGGNTPETTLKQRIRINVGKWSNYWADITVNIHEHGPGILSFKNVLHFNQGNY